MTPRRTHRWLAWDAATHNDARLAELKFDHGPAALAVYAVLLGEAKRQRDDGTVGLSYRLLGELIGLDGPDAARAVLESLQEVQLIEASFDDRGAEVTILDWHKLQPQRQLAADRKALQRERDRVEVSTSERVAREPDVAEEQGSPDPPGFDVSKALSAPTCGCARPIVAEDADGDRRCSVCGKASA